MDNHPSNTSRTCLSSISYNRSIRFECNDHCPHICTLWCKLGLVLRCCWAAKSRPRCKFRCGGFALTYLAKSHYPPVVAVFFAAVIAASTGILIWIPSIRMSGAYLGIVTLAILLLFSDIAL